MFGKKLAHLRKIKGLTQRELAKILNISNSTLAMYELDKRRPDFETLKKIGDYLSVSIDYLLDDSSENPISSTNLTEDEIMLLNAYRDRGKSGYFGSLLDFYLESKQVDLSKESKEDLEKYINLLKIKDIQIRNGDQKTKLNNSE